MLIDMSKSCKYRLILSKTKNCEKLSDCLVFCRNILAVRQLTVWRLSAYCLDGLLMKGKLSDVRNSDDRNCMRWQNPENRNMGVTTLAYWASV